MKFGHLEGVPITLLLRELKRSVCLLTTYTYHPCMVYMTYILVDFYGLSCR